MHEDLIRACPLFAGLDEKNLAYALDFFSASERDYKKGDFLNRIGFPLPAFGLVLSGGIQVYMDDIDGHEMIMANVEPGGTFGESLCYLSLEAPIYIRAISDCTILWLSTDRVCRVEETDARALTLSARFTAMLARRALSMNDRIQILSKPTLRRKLIAFFTQYAHAQHGYTFEIPFSRADMAVYLGTDRTALSRELARMKREGLIDFHKNSFRILKESYDLET